MTSHEFDRLLKKELTNTMEEDAQQLLALAEQLPEHPASSRHLGRMRRLLKHPHARPAFRLQHALRYAAVFLLVLGLTGAVLFTSPQVQAAFIRVLRTDEPTHTKFDFYGTGEDTVLPDLAPTWLPEGYELVLQERTDTSSIAVYQDSAGNMIHFQYALIADGTSFHLDNEQLLFSHSITMDFKYDVYVYRNRPDQSLMVWTNDKETIYLQIGGSVAPEILMKISMSIK